MRFEHLRSALKRLSGLITGTEVHNDAILRSPLRRLPTEILCMIIGLLDLSDEYHIAQTCRTMRLLFKKDWKVCIESLPYENRIRFLTAIARHLPYQWVCENCCSLHLFDKRDSPATYKSWKCERRTGKGSMCIESYSIKHRHIQLALKWESLGTKRNNHLEALMKPILSASIFPRPSQQEFIYASPRIHNNRFLLFVRKEIFGDIIEGIERCRIDASVCAHLFSDPIKAFSPFSTDSLPANEDINPTSSVWFESTGRTVHGPRLTRSELTGQEESGYCRRCPTDYCISATPDVFTCCSWHDLGSYTSPLDVAWVVHLFGPSNGPSQGPAVAHAPGSVRAGYLRAGN